MPFATVRSAPGADTGRSKAGRGVLTVAGTALLAAALFTAAPSANATSQPDPDAPVEPASVLFDQPAEIPATRIGWHIDDFEAAYMHAVREKKPLVYIATADWCKWCNRMVNLALVCPAVNRLAGQAVFLISDGRRDSLAARAEEALEVENYPTLSVLHPDPDRIREQGRLTGYFDAETLSSHLTRLLSEMGRQVEPYSALDELRFIGGPDLSRQPRLADACKAKK